LEQKKSERGVEQEKQIDIAAATPLHLHHNNLTNKNHKIRKEVENREQRLNKQKQRNYNITTNHHCKTTILQY
jgi:hypothetical protein